MKKNNGGKNNIKKTNLQINVLGNIKSAKNNPRKPTIEKENIIDKNEINIHINWYLNFFEILIHNAGTAITQRFIGSLKVPLNLIF